MGIRFFLEKLRNILADSTTITDYCSTKWEKLHKVYLGYNREDPPGEEDAPAIVIAEVAVAERTDRKARWNIIIGLITAGDTEPTETANKYTFENYVNTEELREKVIEVIEQNQHEFGKIYFDGGTIEDSPLPLYASLIGLQIEELISRGR